MGLEQSFSVAKNYGFKEGLAYFHNQLCFSNEFYDLFSCMFTDPRNSSIDDYESFFVKYDPLGRVGAFVCKLSEEKPDGGLTTYGIVKAMNSDEPVETVSDRFAQKVTDIWSRED